MDRDTLQLIGRSNKGRNLIRLHGNVWTILERRDSVACFNGDPGFLIVPKGKESDSNLSRWFNPLWDDTFHKDFVGC